MYIQPHSVTSWKAACSGLAGSIIANLVLLFAFQPFVTHFAPLAVAPVIMWTVIGFMGAWGVYALLRKYNTNYNHDFIAIAILVLIASFVPDIYVDKLGPMFAGSTPASIALLMAMHVVEALIATYVFTRLTKLRE